MKRVLNLGKLSRLVEGDPNNPEMILDVQKGTAITYSVANTGYQTENGTDVACSDITRKIVLQLTPN